MKNLKTLFSTLVLVLVTLFGFSQVDTTIQFSTEQDLFGGASDDRYTQDFNTFQTFNGNEVLVYFKLSRIPNVNTGTVQVLKNGNLLLEFSGSELDNYDFDTTMVVEDTDDLEFKSITNGMGIRVNIEVYTLLDSDGFPLSTNEVESVEMNMYPNPTTTNLNFEFDNYPNQVTYNVYSMSGQLVKQGELVNTLYVGDLTNGMYVINLNVDGTTTSKKFLKR